MDKSPFCGNEHCLLHHYEVESEQTDVDIVLPGGQSFNAERVGFGFPNGGYDALCKGCYNIYETFALNKNPFLMQSTQYKTPNFCSNEFCWLTSIEEQSEEQTELSIYDQESQTNFETSRNWFKFSTGHNKPYCKCCIGAMNLIANPEHWPEPLGAGENRILLPN